MQARISVGARDLKALELGDIMPFMQFSEGLVFVLGVGYPCDVCRIASMIYLVRLEA